MERVLGERISLFLRGLAKSGEGELCRRIEEGSVGDEKVIDVASCSALKLLRARRRCRRFLFVVERVACD
jgi:hypothetical protein